MSLRRHLKSDLVAIGVRPNKLMGQNFLVSENIHDFLVKALDLNKDNVVVEVGPGFGYLTFRLADLAKKVIAIEKDKIIFNYLGEKINKMGLKNIELINEDILKYNFQKEEFKNNNYKLIGNIPYYLTSFLIRKALELDKFIPGVIIFTIQKEVAERICAKPPKMNILAVATQFYGDVKILKKVARENFWPAPKVDSAVIEIKPKKKDKDIKDIDLFFSLVKKGFSHPRKKLTNNLDGLVFDRNYWQKILVSCKIKSGQRAETLSLEDWKNIYRAVDKLSVYNI